MRYTKRQFEAIVAASRRRARLDTWVYFLTDGEAIKIGRGHPDARRDGLQTGNPRELKILAKVRASTMDESALHGHFASLRIRGEWFKPEQPIFDLIEKLKASDHALTMGALTIPEVLRNEEGINLARYKSPELQAFHSWLFKQQFADPSAASRAACLLSNLHYLESAPELKAIRKIIAEDIEFVKSAAEQEAAT